MLNRKHLVALVFPPLPLHSRMLTEGIVERQLEKQEWTIVEVPRLFCGKSPLPQGGFHLDGAIIWAERRDQWVHDLIAKGVRVVNCGNEWAGVAGVASVHLRHADLHRTVLHHLGALGLHRVVAMGHCLEQRPATQRVLDGFVDAARAAGMQAQVWNLGGTDAPTSSPRRLLEPDKEHALADFLLSLPKPTAIYCAHDHMAFIVCEVAARVSLRVPEDLAVVGQGDNPLARFANPPLTSVLGAVREVGHAAAECLAQWFATGKPPQRELAVA